MSWGHVTDVFNWLVNGGLVAIFALLVRYHKPVFDLLDQLVNHTTTKLDNELESKLKSTAATLVAVFEYQGIPGTEKKAQASARLVELAETFGKSITDDQAADLIEEAYQMTIKPLQPTEIKVGQSIKLDGVTYTLAKSDSGYTLKEEHQ